MSEKRIYTIIDFHIDRCCDCGAHYEGGYGLLISSFTDKDKAEEKLKKLIIDAGKSGGTRDDRYFICDYLEGETADVC